MLWALELWAVWVWGVHGWPPWGAVMVGAVAKSCEAGFAPGGGGAGVRSPGEPHLCHARLRSYHRKGRVAPAHRAPACSSQEVLLCIAPSLGAPESAAL